MESLHVYQHDFWTHARIILAFLSRTSALVVLLLLYSQFSQAKGPFAKYFKHAFGALCFLLLWVWIASVGELLHFIEGAAATVELGANYIFIPNLIITIWLTRLYVRFREERGGDDGRR